jgi:hypothetical protein
MIAVVLYSASNSAGGGGKGGSTPGNDIKQKTTPKCGLEDMINFREYLNWF